MVKLRMKVIFENEYEIIQEYYPKNSTPKDMLNIDIQNIKNDPYIFIDSENVSVKVIGKIIEK